MRVFKFFTQLALLVPMVLQGAQTLQQVHTNFNDFSKGDLENLSLDQSGILRPAPKFIEVAEYGDPIVWKAIATEDGRLFMGTGNDGKVVEVAANGDVTEVFDPEEILTRALAFGPDGALYVGTSPSGRVYRLTQRADGSWNNAEIYFDPEESYIWELKFDPEGNLYIATGQSAVIYQLPPGFQAGRDKAVEYFRALETHFSAMSLTGEGHLLVGSGPSGYIYRVTGRGEGFALYNADVPEIREILPLEDGRILFATFDTGSSRRTRTSSASSASGSSSSSASSRSSDEEGDRDSGSGGSSSADVWTVTAFSGSGSEVYEIDEDGFVELFWEIPDVQVYSLYADPEGGILIGSGKDGHIFRSDSRTDWELLTTLPSGGDVSAILPVPGNTRGDVYLFCSNPSRVYRLSGIRTESSRFTSEIVDAKQIADWGRMDPRSVEGGSAVGRVQIETRTGNTPRPDMTWSDFEALDGDLVVSPNARYMQYRIEWDGMEAAELRAIRMFYRMKNVPPFIQNINIVSAGFSLVTGPRPRINLDISKLTDAKDARALLAEPPARQQLVLEREEAAMTAGWKAFDANKDPLTFRVELLSPGSSDWLVVADDLRDPVYSMNLNGLEEGYYRIRVTADDQLGNLPGEGRTFQKESDPFLVDLTPPSIDLNLEEVAGDRTIIRVATADEFGIVAAAGYTLNGGELTRVFPEDGLHDSTSEAFVLDLSGLGAGSHSLVFEVVDEGNNVGRHQVVFSIE